jgi:hypothetical protein
MATRLQSTNDWFRFSDASGEHLLWHEQLQRIKYSEHQLRLQTRASNNCNCLYYLGFFLHYPFGALYIFFSSTCSCVLAKLSGCSLIFRLSLFDSVFFTPHLFRTYCLAFLRLKYPDFLPPRTVFDPRAVRMNLEWRDLHWMRLSVRTFALDCQSVFFCCVIFKLICLHDTL